MGCMQGGGDPDDKKVQKELDQSNKQEQRVIKLLLLGTGGSGKSTLFKQLQYIHGDGFQNRQRRMFQSQIHEQLIESMKLLIMKCEDYVEDDPEGNAKFQLYDYEAEEVKDDIQDSAERILAIRNNQKLTEEVVGHLQSLWKHKVIQEMFAIRNEICVPDSTAYFFDDLGRITAEEYIPNDMDLLMVRYRTTGMQEKKFMIKGHNFLICDVGGQRNERRKWIHFFNNVTSVIFVVSLSCYDEATFESETNTMVESAKVYHEQVNSEWFREIPFILFLNKSDLFMEKIKTVPITVAPCFSAFYGKKDDPQAALAFIKDKFNEKNDSQTRSIFIHITNATNKDQIEKVFNDVQTMIINWSLERAGLT